MRPHYGDALFSYFPIADAADGETVVLIVVVAVHSRVAVVEVPVVGVVAAVGGSTPEVGVVASVVEATPVAVACWKHGET